MDNGKVEFKLIKRVKDEKFSVDNLHDYNLLLQVGPKDFQVCVTDPIRSKCLLLEEYRLTGVKNYTDLVEVLTKIYDGHHILMAGFWNGVKVAVKNKKFTLISSSLFVKDHLFEYLSFNCQINPQADKLYYYKHTKTDAITVFAVNRKLVDWFNGLYKNITVQVIHQGSAFIEGILNNDDHSHDKSLFIFADGAVLHLMVGKDRKLEYYNQFTVHSINEALKYILLTMKAFQLDPDRGKVLLWGNIDSNSSFFKALYKFIRNVSFGNKPKYLKFNYAFDEVFDHNYFDLYSLYICD